jgi:hypothetical protein
MAADTSQKTEKAIVGNPPTKEETLANIAEIGGASSAPAPSPTARSESKRSESNTQQEVKLTPEQEMLERKLQEREKALNLNCMLLSEMVTTEEKHIRHISAFYDLVTSEPFERELKNVTPYLLPYKKLRDRHRGDRSIFKAQSLTELNAEAKSASPDEVMSSSKTQWLQEVEARARTAGPGKDKLWPVSGNYTPAQRMDWLEGLEELQIQAIVRRLSWLEETHFDAYIAGICDYAELQQNLSQLNPTTQDKLNGEARKTDGLTYTALCSPMIQRLPRYELYLKEIEAFLTSVLPTGNPELTPTQAKRKTLIESQLARIKEIKEKLAPINLAQSLLDESTTTNPSKLTPELLLEATKIAFLHHIRGQKEALMSEVGSAIATSAKKTGLDLFKPISPFAKNLTDEQLKEASDQVKKLASFENSLKQCPNLAAIRTLVATAVAQLDPAIGEPLDKFSMAVAVQTQKIRLPEEIQKEINSLNHLIREKFPKGSRPPILDVCLSCLDGNMPLSTLQKESDNTKMGNDVVEIVARTAAIVPNMEHASHSAPALEKKSDAEGNSNMPTKVLLPLLSTAAISSSLSLATSARSANSDSGRKSTTTTPKGLRVLPTGADAKNTMVSRFVPEASAQEMAQKEAFIAALLANARLVDTGDNFVQAKTAMTEVLSSNPAFKILGDLFFSAIRSQLQSRIKKKFPDKDAIKMIANLGNGYKDYMEERRSSAAMESAATNQTSGLLRRASVFGAVVSAKKDTQSVTSVSQSSSPRLSLSSPMATSSSIYPASSPFSRSSIASIAAKAPKKEANTPSAATTLKTSQEITRM